LPDKIKCEQQGLSYEENLIDIIDDLNINNSTAAAAAITS